MDCVEKIIVEHFIKMHSDLNQEFLEKAQGRGYSVKYISNRMQELEQALTSIASSRNARSP